LTQRAGEIADACTGEACPNRNLDESLTYGLGDMLAASTSERIFIGLHLAGSHGPSYYRKYPTGFAHFTPVCETVQVSKCTVDELYNAYDNTIRYTDFLLADLIAQLDAVPDANVVMLYTSDHGQSLGEHGFYLHGTPPAIAPAQQRRVPFLVWMSDGFQQSRGVTPEGIMPDETYPHDIPFHSVMGAFGMRSDIYKPQFDIFAH
jgi:lipid A ethanolaminephosphotransferase